MMTTATKPTAADRMHDAVYRHRIMWKDLAARVAENEEISIDDATDQVCRLIERKGCTVAVAVAIIDIIVDSNRSHRQPTPGCNSPGTADDPEK